MSAPIFPNTIPSLRLVRNRPIRVYACGPIAKNCWRHKLVPGLREAFGEDAYARARAQHDVVTELPTITRGVVCIGPWFVSCDHGCAHGPGKHGAIGSCDDEAVINDVREGRSVVFDANIERIRRADAVFAYIDRAEAYGSAVEIGFAKALCKPIFIGFSPHAPWRDDMWFAAQAGLGSPSGHVGPVKAVWAKFCETLNVGLKTMKQY
jgi:hypothetical protein